MKLLKLLLAIGVFLSASQGFSDQATFQNARLSLMEYFNFIDGVVTLQGVQKKNKRACFVGIKVEDSSIQVFSCKDDPKEKNEEKKCAEFEMLSDFKPKHNPRNKMSSKLKKSSKKLELTTVKEVPDLNAKATYKFSIEPKKDGLLIKVKQSGRAFIFLSDSRQVECLIPR